MTVDETESSVGSFNVDILATETDTGKKIVIEPIRGYKPRSYWKDDYICSRKNANIIIWIVRKAREEHRLAVECLNSHTDDDIGFFCWK